MSDAVDARPEQPLPANALGGLAESIRLLEFDQTRQRLAAHARTVIGRERALALAPLRDLLEIATLQEETTEARRFVDRGGGLEFGPDQDFREIVGRALRGGVLRGLELYALAGCLRAARSNRDRLRRQEELPLLAGLATRMPDLADLEQAILGAISPGGEVLDGASPTLRQLRQDARAAYQRLNELMERALRRFQRDEALQESIITQRNGRLVVLVKADMKGRVPGIVHDVSDSGATVFVEPMAAIEPGNQWRESLLAQQREEERVLRQLSAQVGDAGADLLLTLDLQARLDLALARGLYSLALRAAPPEISGQPGRRVRLMGARHPLLTGRVVPISVTLSGEQPILLITGPNAGGKTVALKTLGLLALMAHAGLHVPADAAQFPLLDGVYADIGDQQSIAQSLSTFSSHAANLRRVMEQATSQSLVLIDELGTSTDPEEGAALAKATLGYFRRRAVLTVATSHQRGVARFVQEQPGMVNASVDLDPNTLEPTYRLTAGLPGRSYALTIAARLGLPAEIIEEARSLLSPVEQATDNLLRELQEERRSLEQLRAQAEAALARARRQEAEAEARLADLETTKLELVESARQELQERIGGLLAQLSQAERAVSQAEAASAVPAPATRQELRERRAQLQEAQRQLRAPQWQPIELRRTPWQERLQPGDRVYLRGIPRPVEVLSPLDADQQIEALLGTMRAKIPVYQLERPAPGGSVSVEGQPARAPRGVHVQRAARAPEGEFGRGVSTGELDLRGQRVEAALEQVEELLNTASLDGRKLVRIIHGKGTGALRSAIRDHLAGHPLVERFAPGEGPGGDGVTEARLK